ncbi:MAG: alpha/beta hydrolase [Timaviella obliquedivisa GSE-PSE-MK23-08B]|jgi:dienelactone hydrolase|nr:alpha/beta hydrolase [Timaviella obliquedivisa GSE-PSE-MK23-08B]
MNIKENYKERLFSITADRIYLEGDLVIPLQAESLIILVHSTNKGRYSQSSQRIAAVLHQAGLATLIISLLTLHEEASDRNTKYLLFNANLLAERLGGATDWLSLYPATQGLRMGYFGSGIEAGAAILAAAKKPSRVGAIACLGGRLDLANAVLSNVQSPTLLMVAEDDARAQHVNQDALEKIHAQKQLETIAGASYLSENSEALNKVANLATQWFKQYLVSTEPIVEAQRIESFVKK